MVGATLRGQDVGVIAGGAWHERPCTSGELSLLFTPLIVRFTSFYAQAYVHGSGKRRKEQGPSTFIGHGPKLF